MNYVIVHWRTDGGHEPRPVGVYDDVNEAVRLLGFVVGYDEEADEQFDEFMTGESDRFAPEDYHGYIQRIHENWKGCGE